MVKIAGSAFFTEPAIIFPQTLQLKKKRGIIKLLLQRHGGYFYVI
jgi:hypothetical protein